MRRSSFLGLWIDPALDRAIRAYALEHHMTRSEAVRALLRAEIDRQAESDSSAHPPARHSPQS